MIGNWKLDAIIRALAEANSPLISREIAEKIPSLNHREISQYISCNLLHKYVTATRKPIHGNNAAPWRNLYTLTETGMDKYRRLQD